MGYLIGTALSVGVAAFARVVGLDRDRAFYPTVMIVIAALYVLFATIGGSSRAIVVESTLAAVFVIAAVVGFKRSLWIVAAALAAHGVMDAFHARLVNNPSVPAFWPAFCLAYDVGAALCLAWLISWPVPRQVGFRDS